MGSTTTKLVAVLFVFCGCALGAASASAGPVVNGAFPVTGLSTNNKIVAGPDGNMWVTLSTGKDVARITPAGQVDEFELDEVESPIGITVGPDGNLWVVSINKATRFAANEPEASDKTFQINDINNNAQIVTGPDGELWVTSDEKLIHFKVGDPPNTVQPVTVDGQLGPRDIDVAGARVAVADFASGRIATFATGGMEQDFKLAGGPQGIAGAPDGQMAFSQQANQPEEVGLINPPSLAQGAPIDGDPFGVALGPDNAYWIARAVKGELIRMTSGGAVTTLGGFPAEFFLRQIAAGPGGTLWVTLENPENGKSAVARVSGVEPPKPPPSPTTTGNGAEPTPQPPVAAPETTLGTTKKVFKTKGKKATVKLRFSSPSTGASFECALRKKRKGKLSPIKYNGCKSPKLYRLVPGKYVFLVRAVKDGAVDGSPAARAFKVVRLRS
jgi:virginiamycin B lyase